MGELPAAWVVLIDSLAWVFIHLAVAALTSRLPLSLFDPDGWLFRPRGWESGGEVYQRLFRVRSWKKLLPDGAALFKSGFRKKRMISRSPDYSRLFIRETCRAELMHWLVFALVPLFYLWNEWLVATLMIPYAVLTNVPCIIAQRYNRPRLVRMLESAG
jgi:glycosyl-4,4'-diaponeurosporenoate acyltransferase